MKTWKLVSGILSIVLFVIVAFQSCAAGAVDALSGNTGGTAGAAGILVAVDLLAGGIVSTATRNSEGKGGDIAALVLFGLGALTGFTMHGVYSDLIIWSVWCLINAATSIISMKKKA